MHRCWTQTHLPLLVRCLHWDICAGLLWRLLMTTQRRSGCHGVVTIPGLGADPCLWDGTGRTGWQEACYRHGKTSFESLPRDFCYWKELGVEGPFGLALNIFCYPLGEALATSMWNIYIELLSHQDFMHVPFFHLEIFLEQKNTCVTYASYQWTCPAHTGRSWCAQDLLDSIHV